MNIFAIRPQRRGFTIVELVVVIAVIAILASIVVVSYQNIQQKARVTALVSEIKQVEKAFHLMAGEDRSIKWWRDTSFTGANNPDFADIINDTNPAHPNAALFKKYIPDVPKVNGLDLTWVYDNDGDSASASTCHGRGWPAVLLYIKPVDEKTQQAIDDQIDDGDLECGRVRGYYSQGLLYQLSFDQDI